MWHAACAPRGWFPIPRRLDSNNGRSNRRRRDETAAGDAIDWPEAYVGAWDVANRYDRKTDRARSRGARRHRVVVIAAP